MVRYVTDLPDTNEYALVYWGQSNGRAWGTRAAGFSVADHLSQIGQGLQTGDAPAGFARSGITVNAPNASTGIGTIDTGSLTADRWIGAEVRLGSIGTPAVGYGVITDNTASQMTVQWDADTFSAGSYAGVDTTATECWVTHRENLYRMYRSVRVLTPFTLEAPGDYDSTAPVLPQGSGFTLPATITSWADLGLFLNFSFYEGSEGFGIAGAAVTPGASTIVLTPTIGATADLYAGCLAILTALDASGNVVGRWINTVQNHGTGASATVTMKANWTGGTPSGGTTYELELFADHYWTNPHRKTAGPGFSHPSNEPQPFPVSIATRALHNRAAGVTTHGYSITSSDNTGVFGAMLPFAWKIAQATGKRINIIHLAVNSSGLFEQSSHNAFGAQEKIGWWDPDKNLDWTPNRTDGSFARLKRMIETMAPAALTAEGNTKPLKILGIFGAQGEADTLLATPRENYEHTLPQFYRALCDVIDSATNSDGSSLNYYGDPKKIPICHQSLPKIPWELVGDFELYPGGPVQTFTGDGDALVKKAIVRYTGLRPFGSTIDPEGATTSDGIHYTGDFEAKHGNAAAEAMLTVIDASLKTLENTSDSVALSICNEALALIGHSATISSLDTSVDPSTAAKFCARHYPKARDYVQGMHSWDHAKEREALVAVNNTRTEWACAYGLPDNYSQPIAVLPALAPDDYHVRGTPVPVPFTIETDPSTGYKILYTNITDAHLRFVAKSVDMSRSTEQFQHAVARYLAHLLAGSILKGAGGSRAQVTQLQLFRGAYLEALSHDASSNDTDDQKASPWHAGRFR